MFRRGAMNKSFEDVTYWDLVREAWAMPLRYKRMFWRMLVYPAIWFFAIFVFAAIISNAFDEDDRSLWPLLSGMSLLFCWVFVKWLRAFTYENVDTKGAKGKVSKPIIQIVLICVCSYVVWITINTPLAMIGHSVLGGDSLSNYLIRMEVTPLTSGYLAYYLAGLWLGNFAYVLFLTATVTAALAEPVMFRWPKFPVTFELASYLFVVTLPLLLISKVAFEYNNVPASIIGVISLFFLIPFSASSSLIVYRRMGFSLPENPEPVPNQ